MKKNLLLILLVCVIIFVVNYNKNCSTENFSNVCWSLQSSHSNDIINQNKTLITSLGLNNHINKIIEPLVKPNNIDKKLTLEKYFSNIKIPLNKIDNSTILVKNIVNNNYLIFPILEIDIKKTNLLFDISFALNMNNLINSMLCVINDVNVIMNLIEQLILVIISPKIEFCSRNNFQKYCELSYKNYLNEIKPKQKVKVIQKSPQKKSPVKSISPKMKSPVKSISPKMKFPVKSISPKMKFPVKSISPKMKFPVKSISPKMKSKSKSKSKSYKVQVVNKNELETFTQKLDKTANKIMTGSLKIFKHNINISSLDKPLKYMDIYSLSEYLNKFNEKSFGSLLEKNMMVLITKFKKNNNKNFNIFIKKDFGKLVGILVNDIKMVVKNIVDEDDLNKLKPLVNEFNNLQKIFYLLKHNYRLLLTYELINKKIVNNDEKLQAQLCCSKTSEKSCFNFSSNPKKSLALFYGFDELGYVNNVKCIKENEASKVLHREQNMTIDELFNNKYAAWRNLTKKNKLIIFANLNNIFKIFGIKLNNINDKIINIRLELEKQKYKLNMSDFKFNKIETKLSDVHLKFKVNNNNYKKLLNQIKTSDNFNKLNEILKVLGYSKDHIIFNNNVDLTYAKNITETLLFINEIFNNFESKNPIAVGKLLGIIKTPESFNQIMKTTTIFYRYHQTVVNFVIKNITDKKFATVRSYTMNSLPETTIKYVQSKPSSSDLNFCNVHEEFLLQLRKDRSITNNEFVKYLRQSYLYCNPNKVNIKDIKKINIPKNIKKGLPIIQRRHESYNKFMQENKDIVENKLESKVISDNILYNTLKNTYN